MLPGFRSVPFDDAGALRDAVGENTAAVLIEPIQGESGIYPLSDETLLAARAGLRRNRGAADPRRDPDRDGADRLALGLRADARAARPADQRQGARRRPADRRLRDGDGARRGARARRSRLDLRRRGGGLGGGARGARPGRRPGAAARACASWAAALREGLLALDGVRRGARPRPDARASAWRAGSTPRRSAPTCSSAA